MSFVAQNSQKSRLQSSLMRPEISHAQHPTCPSMVLPDTYRACFVSSKLKKKKHIVLLNYSYCFICYERNNGNMEQRAYHDVPANGDTFASVFLTTESSILHCFQFTDSCLFRPVKNKIQYTFTALDSSQHSVTTYLPINYD